MTAPPTPPQDNNDDDTADITEEDLQQAARAWERDTNPSSRKLLDATLQEEPS